MGGSKTLRRAPMPLRSSMPIGSGSTWSSLIQIPMWTRGRSVTGFASPTSITRVGSASTVPTSLSEARGGDVDVHEVKGGHLMQNPDTKRKFEAAKRWCAERGMKFVVVTKET